MGTPFKMALKSPVGARLAREGIVSVNINIEGTDAFAGKPCSHRFLISIEKKWQPLSAVATFLNGLFTRRKRQN
jgi:hypothetical protein